MRSCLRRLMLHSLHRGLRGGLSAPIGQVMGRTENGLPKGEECDPWDISVCPHSEVLSREPCIVIRGQGPIGLLGAWKRALVGTGALRRATKGPVRVLTSGSSQSGSIRVRGIRSRSRFFLVSSQGHYSCRRRERATMPKRDDDDDDRRPEWDCQRGVSWERVKRKLRPYLAGVYSSSTDDWNLWDGAAGTDQGGDAAGAVALPAGHGLAGAQGRRNRRQNKLWSILCEVPRDETMKNLLLALPSGDLAVPTGGFHGIGRRAFLLLEQHGTAPFDDEYIQRKNAEFTLATIINLVGYSEGSIAKFMRELGNLVFLVPAAQQPDENRYCTKLLECLSKEAPQALALEATKQRADDHRGDEDAAGHEDAKDAAAMGSSLISLNTAPNGTPSSASICSSDLPLVSGTHACVKASDATHSAA